LATARQTEAGHEAEFEELYDEIFDRDNKDPSLSERLWGIAITPYATLGAPLGQRYLPESVTEWDDPATKAHIVDSAARWCLFWSQRGHGMMAWF
jgi:hypothetical protein